MKNTLFIAALALVLGFFPGHSASAQPSSPDAVVKAFYVWYINTSERNYRDRRIPHPLEHKRIYSFVYRATADQLRTALRVGRLPGDSDYFLKAQDMDEVDWPKNIMTSAVTVLGDVAVVPTTIGSRKEMQVSFVVFLRKVDKAWKIVKVIDTYDYY